MSFEEKAKCFRDGSRVVDSLWEAAHEIDLAKDHLEASMGQAGPTRAFGESVRDHVTQIVTGLDQMVLKSLCISDDTKDKVTPRLVAASRSLLRSKETGKVVEELSTAKRELEGAIAAMAEYPYSVLN